ncbi:ELKS/Rab6-interacting/CAST family member 1-like isoform X3 [Temnothorax curvispinosus]|uniref:ELKS/Rab6-interacting/CAST family member 1-like isoform X3 n=1 Tax=Temnothorax curvispinosus TaxID=300111 RepID=A0A6J1R187_9HYME|nr:ELKS/Rab6-interacting/CAST family member 1-like isoform X3 [Temnothorax curvispinosus]
MSRDPYSSSGVIGPGGGTRSPRSGRRVGELPTVDRSPSRSYASGRGSPLGGRKQRGTRSGNNSPEHLGYGGGYHHHQLGSPYYSRDEDLGSPVMLEERGRSMSTGGGGGGHHRSRSASRPAMSSSAGMVARYTSLDRASAGVLDHEFVPIREPSRERSRDRGLYLEDELYGSRSARQSPNPHMLRDGGGYIGELQHQNNDLQRELGNLKKELELTNQKLGSSMHSIKTFWSPELKKERALRKEESTKYSLINEQLKLLNSENQKQSMMVRQLEEELRMRMRGPSVEMQQQMEVLYNENEHLTREIAILRDTIKELELRIETQKQTLQARDESIKKLLEMLQNKGIGKEEERLMFQQMQSAVQKQELKATNENLKSLQTQLELAYASTASSGHPVVGGGGISGLAGASVIGLGSVSGGAGAGVCGGGTVLGGSVAVPGGVPGSTTLTAIMETKDARITTLEKEVALLEAEMQRIKETGGRLREQLLKAIAVPSSGGTIQQQQQQQLGGMAQSTGLGGQQQPGTLPLARGPSMMTSLVPYGGYAPSAGLTSSLLAGSTGGTTTGSGGGLGVGGGSSCLAGISSGATTGVVNPYTDRYATDPHHPHQMHHHQHHHHHHLHQQHQLQLQQQQQMQQHLKHLEPAAAGALALHAHTFNKHDLNFKRQVSFFINNVRIEKNDAA